MRDMSIERVRASMAAALIGAAITVFAPLCAASQNAVVDWNAIAITAAGAAGQNGSLQERSIAITSVAVSDAVNAITNEYTRYGSISTPPAGASTTAAAVGAAYRALTQLLSSQTQFLDTMLAQSLAKYGVSPGDQGFVFGEAVADEIVAMRSADGAALAQYPYTPPNAGAPGVWVATPPAFAAALLPGWGFVQPWVLESGAQFRPDESPDVTSRHYGRDLNEVKEIGALNSATRTAQQTNIARFWVAPAVVIWNGVLRQVALGLDLDIAMPKEQVSGMQGIMQAIQAVAGKAGLAWLVPILAALVALNAIGGVGGWFAATARLPFVAGIDRLLPRAFGELHPRWRTPYVALLVQAVIAAGFVFLGQAGTSVHGATSTPS